MKKGFIFMLGVASLCCAQLMPGGRPVNATNSATANALADTISTLKVKAPVNYNMLVSNVDARDNSRESNVSDVPPVHRRKRTVGSDIAVGALKIVGASVGAFAGAAAVGAIVGEVPGVIYGSSGGFGIAVEEEIANDVVGAGAYVGAVIGDATIGSVVESEEE